MYFSLFQNKFSDFFVLSDDNFMLTPRCRTRTRDPTKTFIIVSVVYSEYINIDGIEAILVKVGALLVSFVKWTYRRRIYTEEKTKVVADVWRTEFIQFLSALAVLHQDDMLKRMNCT